MQQQPPQSQVQKLNSDYLFAPSNTGVAFLVHGPNDETYSSRFASVVVNTRDSALLQFHSPDYPVDEQCAVVTEVLESVVLDLAARVSKLVEEKERSGSVCMITYLYQRFDVEMTFDVLPIHPEKGPQQILVLDFILSQFTWFDRSRLRLREESGDASAGDLDSRSPNALATGFEKAGSLSAKASNLQARARAQQFAS